jgi:hypothetical protein
MVPAVLGGGSALQTFGETGSKLRAAISGVTGALTPKFLEVGGQSALKALGAKTAGELDPELASMMDKTLPSTQNLLSKYQADSGWGPTSLLQRGGRIAGAQAGLFAGGQAGQALETATRSDLDWRQKLGEIGSQFSPSNLVAAAVGQLPFLPFEIFSEKTHPITQLRNAVESDFARRYTEQAMKGDPESGSPPFVPTPEQIERTIKNVTTGRVVPDSVEGQVLKSMGELPLDQDPVITAEAVVPMNQAMNETRDVAQRMALAQGVKVDLGSGYDQTFQNEIRAAEKVSNGKASKDSLITDAAAGVLNKVKRDQDALSYQGTTGGEPGRWWEKPGATAGEYVRRFGESKEGDTPEQMAKHADVMKEIVAAITPGSETYDQAAHQRVALASGDLQHRLEAGITEPVHYLVNGPETTEISNVGGTPVEVKRRDKVPVPLDRSIIDQYTGLPTKPSLDAEVLANKQRIQEIQQARDAGTATRADVTEQKRLQRVVNAKLNEAATRRRTVPGKVLEGGQPQSAIFGETTFGGVQRAFNYGSSPEDIKANKVLDLKDPESVTRFRNEVIQAMKRDELDAVRRQTRGESTTLDEVYGTDDAARARAEGAAETMTAEASGETGDYTRKYRAKKDKTGNWRVNEELHRTFRELGEPEGLQAEEQALRASFEPEPGLKQLGRDPDELVDNRVSQRFHEIGTSYSDPAEVRARKQALSDNVTYFLDNMSDSTFEKLVLDVQRGEGTQKSIQKPAILKQKMMRYLQFMRDGGRVTITKTTPPGAPEGSVRLEGGDPNRPERTANTQLINLNNYMNAYGLGHGNYPPSHPRAGEPRVDNWNRGKVGGLNFFEQFAAVMNEYRKQMPDPRAFGDAIEHRPLGDFGGVPKGFVDDFVKSLVIKWNPELSKGVFAMPGGVEGAYPAPKEPIVMITKDRQGKEVRLESSIPSAPGEEAHVVNPLQRFFIDSTKRDLTMPLGQVLDLFEKYGLLDGASKQLLALGKKLSGGSAFIRDMPVGVNPAKDPNDKAYFHTDHVASSAGMLMSPFKATSLEGRYGPKYIRELMEPNEFFPHLMNEIGHAATDFAYSSDLPFRNEVDRIFQIVKDEVEMRRITTAETDEFTKVPLHALENPREFLASIFNDVRLHKLLQSIDDPDPLPGRQVSTGYVGSLFDRFITSIRNMLTRLFGIGDPEAQTMLNRMTQLASQAYEKQQAMTDLRHRGDIYLQTVGHQLFGRDILQPRGAPPVEGRVPIVSTPGMIYPEFQTRRPEDLPTTRQPAPLLAAVIRNHESKLADARTRLQKAQETGAHEEFVKQAQAEVVQEETMLRKLRAQTTGARLEKEIVGAPPTIEELRAETQRRREYKEREKLGIEAELTKKPPERPGAWTVSPEGQVHVGGGVNMPTFEKPREGEILKSRLVPEEDERTEIAKPIFNIQGRKGTMLRDPVVNNIVTTFAAGQNVRDAFSGSGQLSTFAKNAGANRVAINVYRPEMHSIFNEVKTNPIGFGRRVANVARLIDSRRSEVPRMRDGSDLRTYLDQVQARDPNVGLFMKQNLSYFGREVGKEAFTPSATITNQGLSELPARIRQFSRAVDEVTNDNGWNVVAKAQPGERVMVDPPYIGDRTRYGEPLTSPQQRVAEYEKYMYPAADNGARFLVFDVADPLLMQSLSQHGFTVQPIQRTARVGGAPKQEFVAYNHNGEIMASKVDGQAVLDSMKHASLYLHEDPRDRIWFRPYDPKYFRDSYGPAFGAGLRYEPRGSEEGYSISKNAVNGLTPEDLAAMPPPQVKPWAPSLFETMRGLFRDQGSSSETSAAQATRMLQLGALLRNTDMGMWGRLKSEQTKTGWLLGAAWGWKRVAGLTPEALTQARTVEATILHESAHMAGLNSAVGEETPDVRAAYKQVTDVFNALDENGRRAFLDGLATTVEEDGNYPGRYEAAVTNPSEFASEFMAHAGDVLGNVPKPSAYLRDEMRFVSDEMSRLLILNTLRRAQGLDRFVRAVELTGQQRGIKNVDWEKMVNHAADAFKSIARPALEIANDQAEFFKMRNVFPDMYQPLLNNMANELVKFGQQYPMEQTPVLPGEILPSRTTAKTKTGEVSIEEGSFINNMIRRFFPLPDTSGKLPTKLSLWDKMLTNFSQFTDKFPQADSAWDMFFHAKAFYSSYRLKMATALAGAFTGKGLIDDARTKQINEFTNRPDLRNVFNKVALDLNTYGDTRFDKERATAGDIMAMNPQEVTGWLTPEWIKGALKKYGVSDKDLPTMMTVLDGTRNQIKLAGETMVRSASHRLDMTISMAVARNTDLPPEAARKTAELLTDAVKLQTTDVNAAMQKIAEFQQTVQDPTAFAHMLDAADTAWQGIQVLERFLTLRMPYFMSERRPGQFGLFFKDKSDKVTSRYFANDAERRKYIVNNDVDPVRQTNPGDRDWGVSPAIFKQLDEVQARTKEKLVNLFGQDEGNRLAAAMDMASDLRDSLNSRDVLKATTGRDLAPGREELDMFAAHQQYVNALGRAAFNTTVRLETELLNTDPAFRNQPAIKEYINQQVKQVLLPDSVIGRWAQNVAFLHYLFGNISSMIMQMSHQVMGLAPQLTARGSSVADSFNTIRKANQLVVNARLKGKYADPLIDQMVNQAHRDGSLGSWIAEEMGQGQDLSIINRARVTMGKGLWTPFEMAKNRLMQGYDLLRNMYNIVPTYTGEVAFVASLLHLQKYGGKTGEPLVGDRLYREAQFLRSITMFTGGKTDRPGLFQYLPRSAAQGLWSLQTYANGLTTMMGELLRRSWRPPPGFTPAQTKQVRKAAAQMLITQTAVAGVLGMPFFNAALYGLQKLFPEHNFEEDIREALASLFGDDEQMGNMFSSIMTEGVPTAIGGADMGSRFALAGTFHVSPYSGVGWEQLAGPAGGVLGNAFEGLQAGIRGDPVKTVQSLMPTGFQRIWKALEQGKTYQTESGQQLVNDLSPEEIVARMIGFGPSRVAHLQDFERLSRVSEDAEKAEQTRWVKEQVKLIGAGQDAQVQQNLAERVASKKGLYPAERLSNDIGREYERETMPVDPRAFGNRATVLAQRKLLGVLGTQSEGPSNVDRLLLQQSIAMRLGLGGPSRGSLTHAAQVDQLLQLYPQLTKAQADLLLTHAAASQPSPDLYSELLGEPQ